MSDHDPDIHPFEELSGHGLLWLINRVCFHPRGYALAIHKDADSGTAIGWSMLGDGTEVWTFKADTDDEEFAKVADYFGSVTPEATDPCAPPLRAFDPVSGMTVAESRTAVTPEATDDNCGKQAVDALREADEAWSKVLDDGGHVGDPDELRVMSLLCYGDDHGVTILRDGTLHPAVTPEATDG